MELKQAIEQANESLAGINKDMFTVLTKDELSCINGEYDNSECLFYISPDEQDVFDDTAFFDLTDDATYSFRENDSAIIIEGSAQSHSATRTITITCFK